MVNLMGRSFVPPRGIVEISLVASLAFGFYRVAGYLPSFRLSGVKMPEAGLLVIKERSGADRGNAEILERRNG
jgi:hypothetical protein